MGSPYTRIGEANPQKDEGREEKEDPFSVYEAINLARQIAS